MLSKFEELKEYPKDIKIIERKLEKDGIIPNPNWYKSFLVDVTVTTSQDTFYTLYNRKTKRFFTSCAFLNPLDKFNEDVAINICCNRMAMNTDFVRSIPHTTKISVNWDC